MVCGSEEIKKTIEKHLNIHEGETTADGMFTLREVYIYSVYILCIYILNYGQVIIILYILIFLYIINV